MGKQILIILPRQSYDGGAERSAKKVGDLLSKECTVHYICLHRGDFKANNELNLDIGFSSISKIWGIFYAAWRVKRYIESNEINVVISHLPRCNHTMGLVKLISKQVGWLAVVHSYEHNGWLHQLFMKLLWTRADKIVTVSLGIAEVLKKMGLGNTQTIYTPVSIDSSRDTKTQELTSYEKSIFLGTKKIVVLVVARFVSIKNHLGIVSSFALAPNKEQINLVLVGDDGPTKEKTEALVKKLGLSDSVFFLPTRKDIESLYRSADYVMLGSFNEGFGLVLLESLLLNTPVISTDCMSGPRELILPGVSYKETLTYPYETNIGFLLQPVSHSNPVLDPSVWKMLKKSVFADYPCQHKNRFKEHVVFEQWMSLINS